MLSQNYNLSNVRGALEYLVNPAAPDLKQSPLTISRFLLSVNTMPAIKLLNSADTICHRSLGSYS